MHLVITRPIADAEPLAEKLRALGHSTSLAPLFVVEHHEDAVIPPMSYQAVILTSANAVRALKGHPGFQAIKDLPAYVVGPQSHAAAVGAGFTSPVAAAGTAGALSDLVAARLSPADGPILYLSGFDVSGDIAGNLGRRGFTVARTVLYRAQAVRNLPQTVRHEVEARAVNGVLLYSQRAARVWIQCVEADGLRNYMDSVVHYCLSEDIARTLPDGLKYEWARRAEESSMLDMISSANGEGGVHNDR